MKKFKFVPEFRAIIQPIVEELYDMFLDEDFSGGFPPSCEKLTPMFEKYNEYMKDKTEKDLYYAVTD